MKRLVNIRTFLIALAVLTGGLIGSSTAVSAQSIVSAPATYFAASESKSNACAGLSVFGEKQCNQDAEGSLGNTISKIVNILTIIIGIIAVIMIIISGLRFMTSGGDSSKTAAAKNGFIYALIGLIVIALAQLIVKFTVNRTIGTQ
jgi:hypothetical protein